MKTLNALNKLVQEDYEYHIGRDGLGDGPSAVGGILWLLLQILVSLNAVRASFRPLKWLFPIGPGFYAPSREISNAQLWGLNLKGAVFANARIRFGSFLGSRLHNADFSNADLTGSDFRNTNLTGANLSNAVMNRVKLDGANLTGCQVYGASFWDVSTKGAIQKDLIISPPATDYRITLDNIELAQFMYNLVDNVHLRDVIDTVSSKVVLILGRFSDDRKAVLLSIKEELRKHDYIPVLFDFPVPESRDLTETISLLANLSRFIIADISESRSIPQELQLVIPILSVPVVPIFHPSSTEEREYGMFESFRKYPWVLELEQYSDPSTLIEILPERVILRAERKLKELRSR